MKAVGVCRLLFVFYALIFTLLSNPYESFILYFSISSAYWELLYF